MIGDQHYHRPQYRSVRYKVNRSNTIHCHSGSMSLKYDTISNLKVQSNKKYNSIETINTLDTIQSPYKKLSYLDTFNTMTTTT